MTSTMSLPPRSVGASKEKTKVQALPTKSKGLRPNLSAERQPTKTKAAKKNTDTSCIPKYSCWEKPRVLTP